MIPASKIHVMPYREISQHFSTNNLLNKHNVLVTKRIHDDKFYLANYKNCAIAHSTITGCLKQYSQNDYKFCFSK